MKGLLLDGFVTFVRTSYGVILIEEILASTKLASGGIYTSIGTYDSRELHQLVGAVATRTNSTPGAVLRGFGQWLFPALMARFPQGEKVPSGTIELLRVLDAVIHVEVRKLYPDSELPRFEPVDLPGGGLEVRYTSTRGLADLAEGLITGSVAWYKTPLTVTRRDNADGSTIFRIEPVTPVTPAAPGADHGRT